MGLFLVLLYPEDLPQGLCKLNILYGPSVLRRHSIGLLYLEDLLQIFSAQKIFYRFSVLKDFVALFFTQKLYFCRQKPFKCLLYPGVPRISSLILLDCDDFLNLSNVMDLLSVLKIFPRILYPDDLIYPFQCILYTHKSFNGVSVLGKLLLVFYLQEVTNRSSLYRRLYIADFLGAPKFFNDNLFTEPPV